MSQSQLAGYEAGEKRENKGSVRRKRARTVHVRCDRGQWILSQDTGRNRGHHNRAHEDVILLPLDTYGVGLADDP
jgi:hypothetical protein